MECMCAYWGSPKVNFQNKRKKNILSYRIIRIKRIFFGVYWPSHSQTFIKVLRTFICLWVNWSRLYINKLRKNAFNPYNSVTKFFLHLFWKFTFGDPQYAHIHSIDGCRPWITKWTNLISYFKSDGDVIMLPIFSNLMAFCI